MMTTDENLYGLMAQAEEIQKHAVTLQKRAEETFSALPDTVDKAAQKIRSTGLLWGLVLLALGVVIAGGIYAFVAWTTAHLRDEAAILRTEIAQMEGTAAQLAGKTWQLELVDWGNDGRGIVLPKGMKFVRAAQTNDGRIAVVITR